eukprot:189438-Pleurochrysis_carterae.AAC.1
MPILQERQRPFAYADCQGLRRAVAARFRNNMIRRQAPPQRSHGGDRVDAMHVDTASDIEDD